MNETVIKPGLIKRIVDNLDGKRKVIGGNKYFYKRKYHLQYTQEMVDDVLTAFLKTLEQIVEEGDEVKLNGYFSLKPTFRKATTAMNVYENKRIQIPAQYRLKFKVGSKLTDACKKLSDNEGTEEANS